MKRLFALALVVALGVGIARAQQPDYIVGSQDVLTITVYDQAGSVRQVHGRADGNFTFPLVGRIKAGGMKLHDIEHELQDEAGRRLPQEPAGDGRDRDVPEPADLHPR